MIKKITRLTAITILVSSCSTGEMVGGWNVTNLYDEFTESKTCRIEYGNPLNKSFLKGFTGQYFTYHFYTENKDGEVRAGIRSEPQIPISGDIQIKMGKKLITMTSKDTPLDTVPESYNAAADFTMPEIAGNAEYNKAMKLAMKSTEAITKNVAENAYKMASPYRAFTGKKAKNFLNDAINYGKEIKFRTVGINSATSGTGKFTADADFVKALKKCGIDI